MRGAESSPSPCGRLNSLRLGARSRIAVGGPDGIYGRLLHEISNRGRKLQPEAIEFGVFLKTHIARRVGDG